MAPTNPFRPLDGMPGVYTTGRTLMTVNSARDMDVYGERLVEFEDVQYRAWDPSRSKLAAVILLGARDIGLDGSSKVLYLGAASGTTASHVSDIATSGLVYCIEVSQRSFRDLVRVCETRKNMIPIMANASLPQDYSQMAEGVDFVYQDIAQRDQAEIFAKNMRHFGVEHGMLMLKARSVDVNRKPRAIFSEVKEELASKGIHVREVIDLNQYARDHAAFLVGP